MLCCVGLFAGLAVGQSLGGPWSVIAPAAGFGIGFVADSVLMKRMHGHHTPEAQRPPPQSAPPAPGAGDVRPAAPPMPALPRMQPQPQRQDIEPA
ncbi:MAG TPA: hypothetical protein VKD22_03885 [Ramlibacter sp.]|nr:hypothetical protein [Ramlibacter sp.]